MNIKIRSTVEAIPTTTRGNCFISREVTAMVFDFKKQTSRPHILEQLFKEKNWVNEVGETITERIIIEGKYKNYALEDAYIDADIDGLFNFLATDIIATNSFMSKFRDLNHDSLLFDTQNIINSEPPMYGLTISEWVKDTDHVIVNEFSEVL